MDEFNINDFRSWKIKTIEDLIYGIIFLASLFPDSSSLNEDDQSSRSVKFSESGRCPHSQKRQYCHGCSHNSEPVSHFQGLMYNPGFQHVFHIPPNGHDCIFARDNLDVSECPYMNGEQNSRDCSCGIHPPRSHDCSYDPLSSRDSLSIPEALPGVRCPYFNKIPIGQECPYGHECSFHHICSPEPELPCVSAEARQDEDCAFGNKYISDFINASPHQGNSNVSTLSSCNAIKHHSNPVQRSIFNEDCPESEETLKSCPLSSASKQHKITQFPSFPYTTSVPAENVTLQADAISRACDVVKLQGKDVQSVFPSCPVSEQSLNYYKLTPTSDVDNKGCNAVQPPKYLFAANMPFIILTPLGEDPFKQPEKKADLGSRCPEREPTLCSCHVGMTHPPKGTEDVSFNSYKALGNIPAITLTPGRKPLQSNVLTRQEKAEKFPAIGRVKQHRTGNNRSAENSLSKIALDEDIRIRNTTIPSEKGLDSPKASYGNNLHSTNSRKASPASSGVNKEGKNIDSIEAKSPEYIANPLIKGLAPADTEETLHSRGPKRVSAVSAGVKLRGKDANNDKSQKSVLDTFIEDTASKDFTIRYPSPTAKIRDEDVEYTNTESHQPTVEIPTINTPIVDVTTPPTPSSQVSTVADAINQRENYVENTTAKSHESIVNGSLLISSKTEETPGSEDSKKISNVFSVNNISRVSAINVPTTIEEEVSRNSRESKEPSGVAPDLDSIEQQEKNVGYISPKSHISTVHIPLKNTPSTLNEKVSRISRVSKEPLGAVPDSSSIKQQEKDTDHISAKSHESTDIPITNTPFEIEKEVSRNSRGSKDASPDLDTSKQQEEYVDHISTKSHASVPDIPKTDRTPSTTDENSGIRLYKESSPSLGTVTQDDLKNTSTEINKPTTVNETEGTSHSSEYKEASSSDADKDPEGTPNSGEIREIVDSKPVEEPDSSADAKAEEENCKKAQLVKSVSSVNTPDANISPTVDEKESSEVPVQPVEIPNEIDGGVSTTTFLLSGPEEKLQPKDGELRHGKNGNLKIRPSVNTESAYTPRKSRSRKTSLEGGEEVSVSSAENGQEKKSSFWKETVEARRRISLNIIRKTGKNEQDILFNQ